LFYSIIETEFLTSSQVLLTQVLIM